MKHPLRKLIAAFAFAALFVSTAAAAPLGVTVNDLMIDSDGSSGPG